MPFPVKETFKNSIAFEPFRVRFEIGRMPFPVKETFKNSIAFEPFRVRFEIGNPGPVLVFDSVLLISCVRERR